MLKNNEKYNNEISAATCLLLTIASSDEKVETSEIEAIKDIISDFFNLQKENLEALILNCTNNLKASTDFYKYSRELNKKFTYQDKIDFICCAFEVAYSDGNFHYLEEHFIKKISNTLNVEHSDLINAKQEMKKYL